MCTNANSKPMKLLRPSKIVLSSAIGLLTIGLASGAAQALELGAANVRSTLGERLLVEIPLGDAALAAPTCFSARIDGMRESLGMRKTRDALLLSSPRIIVEPLLTLTVNVSCANVATLQRDYTLFIDPASRRPAPETARRTPRKSTPITLPPLPDKQLSDVGAATTPGEKYTVRVGDTVSEIAASYSPDGVSIWPIVDRIVAENPSAFTDGDADRLVAGAILILPAIPGPGNPTRRSQDPTPDPAPDRTTSSAQSKSPASRAPTTPVATQSSAETAQILSVLEDRQDPIRPEATVAAAALSESPFKPLATSPSASDLTSAAVAATPLSEGSGSSWLSRILALIGGMALAVGTWIIWQITTGNAARRRRLQEFGAAPATASNTMVNRTVAAQSPTMSPSATAYEQTIEISPPERTNELPDYEVSFTADDDDDETFSFHNPGSTHELPAEQRAAAPVAVKHTTPPADDDFTVEALDSVSMTSIMRGLDEQTQKLLEQDYETELTQTQQLRRDVAQRAMTLAANAQRDDEPTEEMPAIDETGEMLSPEDIGVTRVMDGVTEAEFTGSPADDDATMPMSLDLDIDDPTISMVLRESAGMLEEALHELEEDDAPEPVAKVAKRQA